MKIGIHVRAGSFSDRWLPYLKTNNINFKVVDCYRSDILEQLEDCDALLWHWHHGDHKAILFARQLTYSLEEMGKKVFPNSKTSWHFDDKVGQKYLLEAINAPLVPSFVFYDKKEALNWVESASFPKVFKLRGGAGSTNVKLVNNKREARGLVKRAFGSGFSAKNSYSQLHDRILRFNKNKSLKSAVSVLKGVVRYFIPTEYEKMHGVEKGYVYFQEFLERNTYDTRIIVIGDKCFAIRRNNRENDFRASGSGLIEYSPELFDRRCLTIGFDIAKRLNVQSIAFDFIFDKHSNPLIVEISYGFATKVYDKCPGFWDHELNWHAGSFTPQNFMVDYLISSICVEEAV